MPTAPLSSICFDVALSLDQIRERVGTFPQPAILESGAGFGSAGRWSLYAARPRIVFEATDERWMLEDDLGSIETGQGGTLDRLAKLIRQLGLANPLDIPDPALPPFQGGIIGFVGYDLAPRLERLPRKAARDTALPDLRFGLYDTAVIVDHQTGVARLHAFDLLGEGTDALERRARTWTADLERPSNLRRPAFPAGRATSNFTRPDYHAAVRKGLDYIAAGDVFQINLSQRFVRPIRADPLELYRRLRIASPAPYSCFLGTPKYAVVSASPELFYETQGDRIITRPIKGTRPRGETAELDAGLATELLESPKDRAELTMIVDLERNDLGRVCEYGSVRVVEALEIESFAQVHHLVATVEGKIRAGVGPLDVVKAMFPGGSITGAPKIRAMEIIDELEPTRRSLYTGAIGYFSRGGRSAFNIAIRTMIVEKDRVSYQVGGGIVADSDPETEYDETLAKGRALRAVLESSWEG